MRCLEFQWSKSDEILLVAQIFILIPSLEVQFMHNFNVYPYFFTAK